MGISFLRSISFFDPINIAPSRWVGQHLISCLFLVNSFKPSSHISWALMTVKLFYHEDYEEHEEGLLRALRGLKKIKSM
jgi:hypothetical protein